MTQASDYQTEVIALRTRIEALEAELAYLKPAPAAVENLIHAFKISPSQAKILQCLSNGCYWSAHNLALECCPDEPDSYKSIHVQISKLRARLLPLPLKIPVAVYNVGYRLEPESLMMVRVAMKNGQ